MSNLLENTVILMIVLALLIEAITLVLRFGFKLESTRDTHFLSRFTFRIRLHHGYLGALMLFTAWIFLASGTGREVTIAIGGALLLSDVVHHFLVLWPITGNPQFHLTYPQHKRRDQ